MSNRRFHFRFQTLALVVVISVFAMNSKCGCIEISGYYENTLLQEYTEDGYDNLSNASKLRVNIDAGQGDELTFTGNVNFISHHLNVNYDLKSYLPETVIVDLTRKGIPTEFMVEKNRIFLDNAYLTLRFSGMRLRAGRQQLSWGSGYGFNPTDLFHRKDMLDPTYEKEGVNALRLDHNWGIGGNLSGIIVPGRKLSSSGYALKLGTHASKIGYDIGLTIHHIEDSTSLDSESYEILNQQRTALGLDLNGSLFGMGVWMEGNFNLMEVESNFSRIVTGFDYTLENGLYLMFEGMYDERSQNSDSYTARDWMEYIQFGEPISRYRYMVGIKQSFLELAEGSLFIFGGNDGSYFLNPRVDVSISQNADMTIFGAASLGDAEGQFTSGSYSVTGRISVYF